MALRSLRHVCKHKDVFPASRLSMSMTFESPASDAVPVNKLAPSPKFEIISHQTILVCPVNYIERER